MKLKILIIIVLAIFMMSLPANARESPTKSLIEIDKPIIGIKYVDVQSLKGGLDISSSGKASVFGQIFARTAEKIKVTLYLKRYRNGSWETYKRWSQAENGPISTVAKDYYVLKGYQYKLYVYGYAWVDGVLVDRPIYITSSVYCE